MVARPTRLVRARMHDLPAEQTDSCLVIVNDVVFVVWRKVVDNVDSVTVVVVGGVECVDSVGRDVDQHSRRDSEDSEKRKVGSSHLYLAK